MFGDRDVFEEVATDFYYYGIYTKCEDTPGACRADCAAGDVCGFCDVDAFPWCADDTRGSWAPASAPSCPQ